MRVTTYAAALLFTLTSAFAMTGCEREGPAEDTGETIDRTMEDMREGTEDAGDAMREGAEDAGDRIEQATDR